MAGMFSSPNYPEGGMEGSLLIVSADNSFIRFDERILIHRLRRYNNNRKRGRKKMRFVGTEILFFHLSKSFKTVRSIL